METLIEPFKIIRDKRLIYLASLENGYKELGYATKLNVQNNILKVYQRGTSVPKTEQELVIERWID